MSTREGVHGGKNDAATEVPRKMLIKELSAKSRLLDSRDAATQEELSVSHRLDWLA